MFDVSMMWMVSRVFLIASMGGIARLLYNNNKKELKALDIFSNIFVSGFTGIMIIEGALWLTSSGIIYLDITGNGVTFLGGMSGWIGPPVFDLVAKKFGVDIDEVKEDKEE